MKFNLKFALLEFRRSPFTAVLISVQLSILLMILAVFTNNYISEQKLVNATQGAYPTQFWFSAKQSASLNKDQQKRIHDQLIDFLQKQPDTYAVALVNEPAFELKDDLSSDAILVIGNARRLQTFLDYVPVGDQIGKYLPGKSSSLVKGQAKKLFDGKLESVLQANYGAAISKVQYSNSSVINTVTLPNLPIYVMSYEQLAKVKPNASLYLLQNMTSACDAATATAFANSINEIAAGELNIFPQDGASYRNAMRQMMVASTATLALIFAGCIALTLSAAALLSLGILRNLRANVIHWLYGATRFDLAVRCCLLLFFYMVPSMIYLLLFVDRGVYTQALSNINALTFAVIVYGSIYVLALIQPLLIIFRLQPTQALRVND